MTGAADIAKGAAQDAATTRRQRPRDPGRCFAPDDPDPTRATRGRRAGQRHGCRSSIERKIAAGLRDLYRTWERIACEPDPERREQLLRRADYRRTAIDLLRGQHPDAVRSALAGAARRREFLEWLYEFADRGYAVEYAIKNDDRIKPGAPLARFRSFRV